jgi:ribosomal protein S12 methylthiotransferase accessory factor YcaO
VEADFGLDRMAAAFSAVYETLQSRETAPVSQREPLR